MNYTNRHVEDLTVKEIQPHADGSATVTADNGWTAVAPPDVAARLAVGTAYQMETRNFSLITGWRVGGEWLSRKTDADLDREHAEMRARFDRERRERLDASRADWQAREAALPEWVRERLEHFRAKGGEHFDVDGWGYELVVAELAVLYAASGGEDDDAVNAYAHREGTSGNQHGMAKALARAHAEAVPLAGTVSALSPITGDPFYERSEAS